MSASYKIGVLVIALGRYIVFWKDFYESAENYFLPHHKKEYFVFTDNKSIEYHERNNVHRVDFSRKGWPWDSMLRFDMFLTQKEQLKNLDYLFFFNIDVIFKKEVYEEILPSDEHDGLITGTHFKYYNKKIDEYAYDRNPKSTAYIPYGQGQHYATGAINGGKSKDFLNLCETCSRNVHIDMENNIVAQWHDESHLNKYLLDKKPLIMPVNYLYPPDSWLPQELRNDNQLRNDIRITLRDKNSPQYGGRPYLRGEINVKVNKFNRFLYKLLYVITPFKTEKERFKKIHNLLKEN